MSNLLLLRADLHKALDDRNFVFFPKADDGFVVHFLKMTMDLEQIHHNSYLHPIPACSPCLLYARFAWAMFPCLSDFLVNPDTSRLIITKKAEASRSERVIKEITSTELRANPSASRGTSLKKRQRVDRTESGENDDASRGRKKYKS